MKKDNFIEQIEQEVDKINTKLMNLEMQRDEALKYIEEECTYDYHLQGFCRGLNPGQVKTLVYKLGGRKDGNI